MNSFQGKDSYRNKAADETNNRLEELITRNGDLHARNGEIRTEFARDYDRILHSLAYRRLKHKTQVFFNIENDHICTRMEHVAHVESASHSIASYLGLNTELTSAIAIGHDLGHAPFGHQGEKIIDEISRRHLNRPFWHEQNSLRFADKIELLRNTDDTSGNLCLTYAVRDGIISHCGEVDENGLRPRDEIIDLDTFTKPGEYAPATWEGCVVKISDKIAYVGRDIEDAAALGFLNDRDKRELEELAQECGVSAINTTVLMHELITDACMNSSPENGICLSPKYVRLLDEVKGYNYRHIYNNPRFTAFFRYSQLVLEQLFETLAGYYDHENTFYRLQGEMKHYPTLIASFREWLAQYCDTGIVPDGELRKTAMNCRNAKIYGGLENRQIYEQAVLDYMAGMTDRFAVKVFNELITY